MKEALVILAQAPLVDQVKTQLIGPLTAEQAAKLYVCFLRDTFAVMETVQEEHEDLSLVLCYTPAEELEAFEAAEINGCLLLPQHGNNLGERIQNCYSDLSEFGFGAVVMLGPDCPTLPDEIVQEAFARLRIPNQVVIGPTMDGRIYLIGMNAPQPQLYEQVDSQAENRWSQIQAQAEQNHIALSLLPPWDDIVTMADLQRLQQQIAVGDVAAKYTSRYLKKLVIFH